MDIFAFVLSTTFMYSAPLIFTALGGVLSEKGGVVNIGLEGMMYFGAFMGAAIAYYSGNPWIGFLAAGIGGGLLALLHAVACVTFKANNTISGLAINFIGPGFALFLSRIMFDGATYTLPLADKKMGMPLKGFFMKDSFLDNLLPYYFHCFFISSGSLVYFTKNQVRFKNSCYRRVSQGC